MSSMPAMSPLPASVRLALWATASYAGRGALADAVRRATPDAEVVDGALPRLEAWGGMGERALLVAFPRPGHSAGLPASAADLVAAAAAAGECVVSPTLGGALVPTIEYVGPLGDQALRVSWTAYEAPPTARHLVEALSLREATRALAHATRDVTEAVEALDLEPWTSTGYDVARARLDRVSGSGLPDGVPEEAIALMARASALGDLCDLGLANAEVTYSHRATDDSMRQLRELSRQADDALATATNVAACTLAGWRAR